MTNANAVVPALKVNEVLEATQVPVEIQVPSDRLVNVDLVAVTAPPAPRVGSEPQENLVPPVTSVPLVTSDPRVKSVPRETLAPQVTSDPRVKSAPLVP